MQFPENTVYPRPYDAERFPTIAHIEIPMGRLDEFERRAADQTQIVYIGHDLSHNDHVYAHAACTNALTRSLLKAFWA